MLSPTIDGFPALSVVPVGSAIKPVGGCSGTTSARVSLRFQAFEGFRNIFLKGRQLLSTLPGLRERPIRAAGTELDTSSGYRQLFPDPSSSALTSWRTNAGAHAGSH